MENKVDVESYKLLLEHIADLTDSTIYEDQPGMHSICEGQVPICKLIYRHESKDIEPGILISFFIDLPPTDVLKWFEAVRGFHPSIILIESYMLDGDGIVFGDEAEKLRNEILEDMIIEKHYKEMEEPGLLPSTRDRNHVEMTPTQDMEEAIELFKTLKRPNDGDLH